MSCSVVVEYRRFGGQCCLHLQDEATGNGRVRVRVTLQLMLSQSVRQSVGLSWRRVPPPPGTYITETVEFLSLSVYPVERMGLSCNTQHLLSVSSDIYIRMYPLICFCCMCSIRFLFRYFMQRMSYLHNRTVSPSFVQQIIPNTYIIPMDITTA
jgi:hypothetical protein